MYVYIETAPNRYTVGHYTPNGTWVTESAYCQRKDAAKRVSMLNGKSLRMEDVIDKPLTYDGTVALLDAFDRDWFYSLDQTGYIHTISVRDINRNYLFDVKANAKPVDVIRDVVDFLRESTKRLARDRAKDEIRKALGL